MNRQGLWRSLEKMVFRFKCSISFVGLLFAEMSVFFAGFGGCGV